MKYTIKQLKNLVLSKLSSEDLCKRYYNQLGGMCPCCKYLGCPKYGQKLYIVLY